MPKGGGPSDAALLHFAARLESFLTENKLLQSSAKSMNNKPIEQQVNHFCAEELHLRSVSFVDIAVASDADLPPFSTPQNNEEKASEKPENEENIPDSDNEETTDTDATDRELFVACESILDPVSGVAIGDLAAGDSIACRLPLDSIYFKLFVSRFPDFDGSVAGEVTGIRINELGTAIVGIDLAEGISGVLKLSGSVRVRLADKEGYRKRRREIWVPWGAGNDFPIGFVLGSIGVFLLLCLIGALLFFLS